MLCSHILFYLFIYYFLHIFVNVLVLNANPLWGWFPTAQVNLRLLNIKRLFIIYPTTNAGGLALQVALPVQEMAYLMQIWNTCACQRRTLRLNIIEKLLITVSESVSKRGNFGKRP